MFIILTPNKPYRFGLPGNWFFRQAIEYVADVAQPDDAVYILGGWMEIPPLQHYAEQLLPETNPFVVDGDGEYMHMVNTLWVRERVWVVAPNSSVPVIWGDPLIHKRFTEVEYWEFPTVNVALYETRYTPNIVPEQVFFNPSDLQLPQNFGDIFWLNGVWVDNLSIAPGETVNIWMEWQITEKVNESWGFFTHFIEDDLITLHGSFDGPPSHLGQSMPTNYWVSSVLIHDHRVITVDPDTLPGIYNLRIGIYNYDVPLRLTVVPGDNHPGVNDGLIIARIEVR
jgi:hypothetical protein